MSTLRIIDVMSMVHAGMSTGKIATFTVSGTGFHTGGMYSVLSLFRRKFFSFDDTIVFCFDRPSFRKNVCKDYKKSRKKNYSLLYQAIELEEGLKGMGFDVFSKEGLESDDLIYSTVVKYYNSYDRIVIHTTDRDLGALVTPKVMLKSTAPKVVGDLTFENFSNQYSSRLPNMPYNAVYLYKMIFGDTSDGIPSLAGQLKFNYTNFLVLVNQLKTQGKIPSLQLNNYKVLTYVISMFPKEYQPKLYENLKLVMPRYVDLKIKGFNYNKDYTLKFLSTFRMKSIAKVFGLTLEESQERERLKALAEEINIKQKQNEIQAISNSQQQESVQFTVTSKHLIKTCDNKLKSSSEVIDDIENGIISDLSCS